jgi:hypothetical protein
VQQVLFIREQILDEHETAEERERQYRKARRQRLKCASLERFDRWERCQPAERLAAAQTTVEHPQRQCERHGDREQRVRKRRQYDVRADFPTRPVHQWRTASASHSRRCNYASNHGERCADARKARPQPRRADGDQADRPADQRSGFGDGE